MSMYLRPLSLILIKKFIASANLQNNKSTTGTMLFVNMLKVTVVLNIEKMSLSGNLIFQHDDHHYHSLKIIK